jgi:hypothetical protein
MRLLQQEEKQEVVEEAVAVRVEEVGEALNWSFDMTTITCK